MYIAEIILVAVIGSIVTAILAGIGILLKMEFHKRYKKIEIINNTGVPLPGKGASEYWIRRSR